MSPAALLPSDFFQAIETPLSREDRPEDLRDSISKALQRQHPDLLQLYAEAYAIPLDTALFLYRRDPKPSRRFVLSALGGLDTTGLPAIAAAARDAWEARDWNLLGQLAFRFDLLQSATDGNSWEQLAAKPSVLNDDAETSSRTTVEESEVSTRIRAAFLRTFDVERGAIPADGYVRSALGYFSALPTYFIPPPPQNFDHHGAESSTNWMCWDCFSRKNSLAWQSVTGAWDGLGKIDRPYLAAVMDHLRQPVEGKLPRLRRLKNPFAGPAGTTALEPRLRRTARRQPATPPADSQRGATT